MSTKKQSAVNLAYYVAERMNYSAGDYGMLGSYDMALLNDCLQVAVERGKTNTKFLGG